MDGGPCMALQVELPIIMTGFRCLIDVHRYNYVWIMCYFGFDLGCNWFNHGVHKIVTREMCKLQLVYRKPGFLRVKFSLVIIISRDSICEWLRFQVCRILQTSNEGAVCNSEVSVMSLYDE